MRNRIGIHRYTHTQDAAGNMSKELVTYWGLWAKVENRTGTQFFDRGQREWNYDYRIEVRYEPSRPIRSSDNLVYAGKLMEIKEVVPFDEGMVRMLALRCQVNDNDYSDDPLTDSGVFVYNYTGVGGEDEFQHDSLIGKRAIGAKKDGIDFTIITTGTPDEDAKEMLFISSTGTAHWSEEFEPDERGIIQYV